MSTQSNGPRPTVGLLGTGLMGSAMAERLLGQGINVIAWSRTTEHAQSVEKLGGRAVPSPADVPAGASIVITMLPTADVILDVIHPLLSDWPEETIWLQMSSVGLAGADRLTTIAREHQVTIVDAPVSGSTRPAREGRLTVLASGPDSVRKTLEPVLASLAAKVMWVGPAGMGSRLKLAANHWLVASVTAVSETMHLCQAMGLDQQPFLDLLDDGPLGSPYIREKLLEMHHRDYPPGFPVRLALKDLELIGEVSSSCALPMPVLDVSRERFSEASHRHADEDLAAVYEVGLEAPEGDKSG